MVFGRHRTVNGNTRPVPPAQWIWSPEPAHPALIDRATWDAAQAIGPEPANSRDGEGPAPTRHPPPTRSGPGSGARPASAACTAPPPPRPPGRPVTYYNCPYDPSNPRHAAALPDHAGISIARRKRFSQVVGAFLADQRLRRQTAPPCSPPRCPPPPPTGRRRPPGPGPAGHPFASSSPGSTPPSAPSSPSWKTHPADPRRPGRPGLPGQDPRPLRRAVRRAAPGRDRPGRPDPPPPPRRRPGPPRRTSPSAGDILTAAPDRVSKGGHLQPRSTSTSLYRQGAAPGPPSGPPSRHQPPAPSRPSSTTPAPTTTPTPPPRHPT